MSVAPHISQMAARMTNAGVLSTRERHELADLVEDSDAQTFEELPAEALELMLKATSDPDRMALFRAALDAQIDVSSRKR